MKVDADVRARRGIVWAGVALAVLSASSLVSAAPPDPGVWASGSAAPPPPPTAAGPALLGATSASWPVEAGVTLSLRLPEGALPMTHDLPAIDLTSLPEAKVAVRKGVGRAPATPEHASDGVTAVCVVAPSTKWAPEAEPLAFSKMADAAKAEFAKHGTASRFDVGDPVDDGPQTIAKISAEAPVADGAAGLLRTRLEGRLLLGFVGEKADVVACVVACTEVSFPAARVCPAAIEDVKLAGALVARPTGSLGARLGAAVLARPVWAALTGFGIVAFFAGLLLAAWPPSKKRPTSGVGAADVG